MRTYNFSPGPAMLPPEVLQQAREELLDWGGDGMSVMEVSHRGKAFMRVAAEAEADLRELMNVPRDYRILFLQGGASAQFALVPMNLTEPGAVTDYVDTGHWSKKAIDEARRYCTVHVAAQAGGTLRVPPQSELDLSPGAAYVHYTPNETISGVEFHYVPDVRGVPLVADMSSSILSRPIEVSRFGLIYAGAQKNIGPSGLTLAIVRDDLLGRARASTPSVFNYRAVADEGSLLNTPPTFAWYIAGLVFKWLKKQGGLAAMDARNVEKARLLYDTIDSSDLYLNKVERQSRSRMNVPFFLADESRNDAFLAGARARGLLQLKGHKSVGGMRASIYNAVPLEGVQALVDYMLEFERTRA
jgi:phosphoserine aminotransferase